MPRTNLAFALVVAAIPAIAGAQQTGTQTQQQQQDSTRRANSGQQGNAGQQSGQRGSGGNAQGTRRTMQSRGGDVAGNNGRNMGGTGGNSFRGRNYGLDQEQIRQLQQALSERTQCDPGSPDGVMGPRTRRALTCARRELGVQGNDMSQLFSALQLDFAGDAGGQGGQNGQGTAGQGNAGQGNAGQGNAGNRGTTGNAGNRGTTGNSGNRRNTGRDSTMRDSTRGQSPGQQPPR